MALDCTTHLKAERLYRLYNPLDCTTHLNAERRLKAERLFCFVLFTIDVVCVKEPSDLNVASRVATLKPT